MSIARSQPRLELPDSLQKQLAEFRRRVWTVKTAEAAGAAAFGVLSAYLVLFALDRLGDTPAWPRALLFALSAAALAIVPLGVYRWIWRRRRPEQLARLIGRTQASFGDQLLGVIELVRNDDEQARSRALCEAAVRQVAEDSSKRDLRRAVPRPRHRAWLGLAAVPAALALGLLAAYPAAATNAWARLVAPWRDVPRYTFVAVEPPPARIVVPHGEPFTVALRLEAGSAWTPAEGEARLGGQAPVRGGLVDGRYVFAFPPQIDAARVQVRIGDAVHRARVEPTLRPELASVVADVTLPAYLERAAAQTLDVRGGSVSLVKGSRATFAATASRELESAEVDGQPAAPAGATITSPATEVDGPRQIVFAWSDPDGLAGKEPFTLSVDGRDDEAPSIACEGLPHRKVVLDSEQLAFTVRTRDDFGVKRVGLEWNGFTDPSSTKEPDRGEQILAAGGSDKELLEVPGAFSARSLGIAPQPIVVRIFAEDYLPGRPRAYSPPYTLFVLDPEQHAIWLTEELNKWHRRSLEVRDCELQLFETNKELRALSAAELDEPGTRRRIEAQANAELANGRRLSGLVGSGEDLVQQAMRNPEFGVGHLETWAEMLQILKDIAANRMPSVADLLTEGARAPALAAANRPTNTGPMAGQVRAAGSGGAAAKPSEARKPPTSVPTLVDAESSQQPPADPSDAPPKPSNPSSPRLTLPVTTLAAKPGAGGGEPPPAAAKVDEAVAAQQDLLAEFEKVAGELNRVLGNLEGSTLVKRLKAAARKQYQIAGGIIEHLDGAFGQPESRLGDGVAQVLDAAAAQEVESSRDASRIMDDMHAYFERRRLVRFQTVLDDMREQDVIGNLRLLSEEVKAEAGLSIAQCEYWSDTFDRWAEDLVDPANSGTCPGGKSRGSLPPSIILEVMMILEGEVNLREETRVAEQARPALEEDEFGGRADALAETQDGLQVRVGKVIERIMQLPGADEEFGYEINLLYQVAEVMDEATGILGTPETGDPAIAAETDAIELLLQSRRINPRGGGGGGANPGGGGTGTTNDSALALVGSGVNDKEVREDRGVEQVTGDAGRSLPEEFRTGLDAYFERLEGER